MLAKSDAGKLLKRDAFRKTSSLVSDWVGHGLRTEVEFF
jgi:hypothetical protein